MPKHKGEWSLALVSKLCVHTKDEHHEISAPGRPGSGKARSAASPHAGATGFRPNPRLGTPFRKLVFVGALKTSKTRHFGAEEAREEHSEIRPLAMLAGPKFVQIEWLGPRFASCVGGIDEEHSEVRSHVLDVGGMLYSFDANSTLTRRYFAIASPLNRRNLPLIRH